MMKSTLLFALIFASCSRESEEIDGPAEFDPRPLYEHYINRLPEFTEDGWIVSRRQDNSPVHQGDSLVWVGIAMAALPCDEGTLYEDRMFQMIEANQGALVRFEPLPDEYRDGREITFDGATGLYFGIASRLLNCDVDKFRYVDVWEIHTSYLESSGGYLHPNVTAKLVDEFTVLPDYIGYLLGLRGKPHSSRIRILEGEIAVWAYAVKKKQEPCFRMHLGWLYLRSLERFDELSRNGRGLFCAATTDTDIPLIDHWCQRSHISAWEFIENEWEYRNQRCGTWETPDGKDYRSPAVDLLLAYSEVLGG